MNSMRLTADVARKQDKPVPQNEQLAKPAPTLSIRSSFYTNGLPGVAQDMVKNSENADTAALPAQAWRSQGTHMQQLSLGQELLVRRHVVVVP